MNERRFICNVCGSLNDSVSDYDDRERASCTKCRSSTRMRAVILTLSRAVFGLDLVLAKFPKVKSLRGVGFSDSDIYAGGLERAFSYTNTYYHREPRLDLMVPRDAAIDRHDFVICSEVLEHVPGDVDVAFATLASLLKQAGVLILTVPYSLDAATMEHFDPAEDSGLTTINGRTVLVRRLRNGTYSVSDQLVFHGGDGATLERRMFSESDLLCRLERAGFLHIEVMTKGSAEFGVTFTSPCSLPVIASREPFSMGTDAVSELVGQIELRSEIIAAAKASRWVRLGQRLRIGPDMDAGLDH